MRPLPVAVLAILAALGLVVRAVGADRYDDLCNDIIKHGQDAAKAFNRGDGAAAEQAAQRAEAAFKTASKIDPSHPQAFANLAVFYLNSQKFEQSLEMWEKAKGRVSDPGMAAYMDSRIQFTKYGFASSQRDKAYASGQGNITEALRFCTEQAALNPSPEIYHDQGTMMVMLGERDPNMSVRAAQALHTSQRIAYQGWLAGKKLANLCTSLPPNHLGIGTFEKFAREADSVPGEARVSFKFIIEGTEQDRVYGDDSFEAIYQGKPQPLPSQYRQGHVYVAEMKQASISGVDGVVSDSQCRMVLPSGREYTNLAANVQMVAVWQPQKKNAPVWHDYFKGRLPNHGRTEPGNVLFFERAASVISYAVLSYYHWVTDGLGRLVLLEPLLKADRNLKVILPKDTSGNKFVTQFLKLLPFEIPKAQIVEHDTKAGPNDVRYDVETLFVPDWEKVRHSHWDASHCLTPPAVLERVRAAFVPHPLERKPVVVYAVRDSERMRRLENEAALRSTLQAALPAGFELAVFRGSESNIEETIRLFASASAIIGVHGGALANTVFCSPGTLVIEIGLRAPQTRHFLHSSLALELDYHLVLLNPDERSVGAERVSATPEDIAAVGDILRNKLGRKDEL